MKRYLLDTHVFLWWITDDSQLSSKARKLIADEHAEIFFSVVSAWEISIKARLGRLRNVGDPVVSVPEEVRKNRFHVLDVSLAAALADYILPPIHADPFDRLLVAQALEGGMPIISSDTQLRQYPAEVLW